MALFLSLLLMMLPGGRVTGTVVDMTGASIAEAQVSVLSAQGLTLGTAITDSSGRFAIDNLPAGSHILLISHPGFSRQQEALHIGEGASTEVRVALEVRQLLEHVTVSAETGAAQDRDSVTQQVNLIGENALLERTTAVLAQVADEEAGISLQRTSPTIGAVLVRGLTEVGVYIDGVRYTNSTQRGGINTFFNLNEPTSLRSVEVLRGPNTAQYGSDSLGGTVQLLSRQPPFGLDPAEWQTEMGVIFNSADLSSGAHSLVTYGSERFGMLVNLAGRRINTLRPGGGRDSHSAITRFLGLPSDLLGDTRLTDTAFTQYSGTLKLSFAPTVREQISLHYQRSQQDGGKRYDQLLGGDGNLVADLRNLMLDFFYGRYFRQRLGWFDQFSATVSYNSQREERVNQGGQGNPLAAITHDKERTSSYGVSFFLDKQLSRRHSLLIGGDLYHDRVNAPSYSLDPATGAVTIVRPRVPNGARYVLAGLYLQEGAEVIAGRLRVSGALRYNVASYRTRSADSPRVGGVPLAPDDSLRVDDFSGRIGAVATVAQGFNIAVNISRGFRAPNITALGSVGLVGVGYQVTASEVAGRGATIGTTADDTAVSTGVAVEPLASETSNNYELSLRYRRSRVDTDLTLFLIDYANAIVRQTLILPAGAVGTFLGSQMIERQDPSGAVYVPLSASPVLVQANFGATRLKGLEYTLNARLTSSWTFGGNYSYVRAEDRLTGAPPNLGGGGLPPQMGLLRLRYQPPGSSYWVEAYGILAGRQDRLSTLDLSDRRTGAARSRTNIQNFFRRGACVRGITTPGSTGVCGSSGGRLVATGETLAEVQERVLGSAESAPLFRAIPGYGLVGLRGGMEFGERHDVSVDLSNLADKSHRAPGWGIDGPGRSLTLRYRLRF